FCTLLIALYRFKYFILRAVGTFSLPSFQRVHVVIKSPTSLLRPVECYPAFYHITIIAFYFVFHSNRPHFVLFFAYALFSNYLNNNTLLSILQYLFTILFILL